MNCALSGVDPVKKRSHFDILQEVNTCHREIKFYVIQTSLTPQLNNVC